MQPETRFTCMPEPFGNWMVWDKYTDAPAILGGCVLKGRSELRAQAACDVLVRIYKNRLDFQSLRDDETTQRHHFSRDGIHTTGPSPRNGGSGL